MIPKRQDFITVTGVHSGNYVYYQDYIDLYMAAEKQELKIKELTEERISNALQHTIDLTKAMSKAIDLSNAKDKIKELKEKAKKVVDVYILTTPTDDVSGSTMVVSKLAKPIIELNEELNKH
jgi:hypothetical protein